MTTETNDPVELVPISLLAAELDVDRRTLEQRVPADLELDNIGIRCVSADVARRLITARDARLTAEREQARKRALARKAAAPRRPRVSDGGRLTPADVEAMGCANPAAAMILVGGEADFDGDRGIPRPGSTPLTFQEGGGVIGPARKPRVRK